MCRSRFGADFKLMSMNGSGLIDIPSLNIHFSGMYDAGDMLLPIFRQKSSEGKFIKRAFQGFFIYLPLVCLWGFNEGVFPGVSLLSRWRLSGSPVDSAIFFGPGLIGILILF